MADQQVPGRNIRYFNPDAEFFGDLADEGKPNQPFIVDLVTREKLFLQTIPTTLEYSAEGDFNAIKSPGRNNPIYHYSGSEDTLEFTISFYANHTSRQDVIKKCKWLESLSKNDGYDNKPHEVIFAFGDLFKQSKWVLKCGPITWSNFDREYRMMPRLASVQISLLRITDTNRLRNNILQYDT